MKKYDFNRAWTVQKAGEQVSHEVSLPHDAMLSEKRCKDAKPSGACGYFQGGRYVYRKQFTVPKEWESKTLIMECEGVYQNASVLVNGTVAAERPYGYSNFFVELNPYLIPGKSNEIQIIADNANCPNSRWYSGSGVYREVQLYVGGTGYIEPEGVKVTVLDEKSVQVDVAAVGDGAVSVEILDGGKVAAKSEGAHSKIALEHARLWDEDHPYLYQCRAVLTSGGIVQDEATVSFGVRTLKWSGEGFFVNGKRRLLRGSCIHHDNGILGACCFRDAEYRRVRIMKEAGFNAIRSAHNPISKAMLDACDELGVYVMDETFDYWLIHKNPYDCAGQTFRKWWKRDTASMISKDFNHPCVVMYSIGNEISELGVPEGQALCKEIAEFVRENDSARAVTCGINLMLASMAAKGGGIYGKKKDGKENTNGSQTLDNMPTSTFFNILMNRMGGIIDRMAAKPAADKVADVIVPMLDIAGYNYATSRYLKEHQRHPDRVIVGSETLPKMLFRNWQLVKQCSNIIGDFMWVGWDYLGEAGIGAIQYRDRKTKENPDRGLMILSGSGVIDICGKQRPEVGWDKAIWGLQTQPTICADPIVHVKHKKAASMWRNTDAVESWSWEGCEGTKTNVTVYTDAAQVILVLNGKQLGRKKVKECKAVFRKVAYVPGTLEAVAYGADGKELSRSMLTSATGKTQLRLEADKATLHANGQDLCFINIDLVGENGITKSSADRKVEIRVEGAGTLQAIGSARPNTEESFCGNSCTTFYGKALAAIRAGYEPGEIRVTVSAGSSAEKNIMLRVE